MTTRTITIYECDRCGHEESDQKMLPGAQLRDWKRVELIEMDRRAGEMTEICPTCTESYIQWRKRND
jgi:hypothetical protein